MGLNELLWVSSICFLYSNSVAKTVSSSSSRSNEHSEHSHWVML